MQPSKSVSLRDIAAKAGVSAISVSRALRNDRKVSKKEAERIRAIAAEMGYAMNPYLSTWMRNMRRRRHTSEREVIAIVSFHSEFRGSRWFISARDGAEQFAQRCGYRVDTFIVPDYPNSATLFRILQNRGIRGVIFAPMLNIPLPEEAWQHSIAAISQPRGASRIDIVDIDHYDGMVLALAQLTRHGFKRIAYWASIFDVATHHRWEAAYHMHQLKLPSRDRLPVRNLFTEVQTATSHADWIKKNRPEVIVCPNNQVYIDLQAKSPSVLRDVSWVSLNREGQPHFAGIDAHIDMVGEAAARMVTRRMELNEIGPPALARTVLIPPDWADGESLRKPAA